jgi:hypothetical protein
MDIKEKFSIIIPSCDKYSDLWEPFFELFWRFFPDCPFNVYLISNEKSFNYPKLTNIFIGKDVSWSDNLKRGLFQIKEDYVFLFIDDLFLVDYVKTDMVIKTFRWMLENSANCIKMNSRQHPDKPYNDLVGIVSRGTIYRTTVMSVWKKNILLELLKDGESAWDFEIYGTVRSDKYDGFYSTWEDCFPVINGVIKGKWQRGAVRRLNLLGIKVDLNRRQMMTKKETIVLFFKELRSKIFKTIPAKYRRKVKDFILGGKYNYEIKKN